MDNSKSTSVSNPRPTSGKVLGKYSHLVGDWVDDRGDVAHVGGREDRVEHLALFLVMVTCAQEVYSLDLI